MCAAVVYHERLAQAAVAFEPVVVEPADVAHPVAVDIGIQSRGEADEARSLRPLRLGFEPRRGIAALRATRADRVHRIRVVPRARLEPVITRGDRADWTHVHQIARD